MIMEWDGIGMVDKNKFFVSKRNTKNGACVRVLSSECGMYIMEPRASNAWLGLAASTVGWRYERLK